VICLLTLSAQAVFPGQKLNGVESVHWTTIGMEDPNPVKRVRCSELSRALQIPMLRSTHCSLLGLQCILYFLQNYYSDAQRMVHAALSADTYSRVDRGQLTRKGVFLHAARARARVCAG
jgi:hypothetical protein